MEGLNHDMTAVAAWMSQQGLGDGPITGVTEITGGTQNIMLRLHRSGREYVFRRGPRHLRPVSNSVILRETRAEFLRRTKFGGVSDARISGVIQVGWDPRGRRMAIVPVIVTVSEAPQVGRVLLLREDGAWRYFDLALPDQVPDLTDKHP